MRTLPLLLTASSLLAPGGGCAHHHRQTASIASRPGELMQAPEQVVIAYTIQIGVVSHAGVSITRYEVADPDRIDWVVRLFAGRSVELRPEEIPPLVAGLDRLIEVPLRKEGYDEVVPRYTSRGGTVVATRSRQPGATVDGVTQYVGIRYRVNDWHTNDADALRELRNLLQNAYARIMATH